ncbi:MAG: NADPH:quinone oxidoreductase family protein [Pseudomonadota bacterium]
MHAFVVKSTGQTGFVRDWFAPSRGPNDVHIRVRACGLNFADLLMIDGTYQETPALPFVPGLEVCGEVLARGDDVTALAVGDRVSAYCGSGGLAEEAVVPANRCRKVPASMPDTVAAGFQIAYGTSHLALTRRARLMPGETLVVLGAAGGVGLTAVEIGHALGARVIGVARGDSKLDIARRAGADEVLDATTDDLRGALRALGGADVIYDAVGGDLGEAALRALRPEGRFLAIGFASGQVPKPRLNHMLVKNIDVIGFYWGGYMAFAPDVLAESLSELIGWHAEDRIHPHISHVLPFDQTPEALDLLKTRKATGKVVVTL